ncbi:Teneurin-3 [Liparis tanakae]|uniref:Teneurin-3 n=1 Tax=Liparis tanakae TaxID=230148 RepID=A0A4Z2ISG4_9TELE|nr:Teneurin-3 [Liparis tanakae]
MCLRCDLKETINQEHLGDFCSKLGVQDINVIEDTRLNQSFLSPSHLLLSVSTIHSNNPAHRYYLATDPVTGQLYVSDTNSRRIYRPKMLSGARDLISNGEVVAGTGEQCPPFDEARCGDGRKATEAQLLGPKGKHIKHAHQTQEMNTGRWVFSKPVCNGIRSRQAQNKATHRIL